MATTGELEAKIAQLEDRLKAMEAEKADEWSARGLIDTLFPAEVRQHMRAARKEQLLAVRSFIDHWIEKQDEEKDAGSRRRETISVE